MFIVKYENGTVEEYTVIRGLRLMHATITVEGKLPAVESTEFIGCKFLNINGIVFDGCIIHTSVFQYCKQVRFLNDTRTEQTRFVSTSLFVNKQIFKSCKFFGVRFNGAIMGSFYNCVFDSVEIDHIRDELYLSCCTGIAVMSSLGIYGRNVLCYSSPTGIHFHIGCFRGNIFKAIRDIKCTYDTSTGVGKAYVAGIKALYLTVKGGSDV